MFLFTNKSSILFAEESVSLTLSLPKQFGEFFLQLGEIEVQRSQTVRIEPSVLSRSLESYCELIWHNAVLATLYQTHLDSILLAH